MASIGSGVDSYVITQIEKRQDRYGQRSRSKATSELLNSNSAFVRLRSSVNEIDLDTYIKLESGKSLLNSVDGVDTKAKNSILTGGTLNASGKRRAGVDITPGRDTVSSSGAYHNSDKLGFRPMPGITSATIKSKGDGGTLQEAEINFTVWSIEDLNNFELCYFRVGYSALLEFGHTVYVDNDNQVQTITESQLLSNDVWFTKDNGAQIDKEVSRIRKDSDGNYDALFGFIKNFNWKLRNDGGYDCSVSLISKGVVINALKEGKTTDHVSKEDQAAEDTEKDKNEGRSIFHFIFYRIDKERKEPNFKMKEVLAKEKGNSIAAAFSDAKVFRMNMTIGNYTGFIAKFLNDSINLVYMPLGTFLEIVNSFCMLKDNTGKNIAEFNPASEETFRTFDGHFSVDPVVAVPPKKPTGKYSYCTIANEEVDLHQQMQDSVGLQNTNLIRNIMVSTHFLRSKVEEFTDGPVEQGAGLLELIRNVLIGIQNALGEVNDFNIVWTEVTPGFHYYEIIDGKMPALIEKKKDIPQININGLSTTVMDVSITSKINSDMASMVSIAAQGNTGNYKENLNNILRFNAGALDRHYLTKSQNKEDTKKKLKELQDKKEEFDKSLKSVWTEFNKSNGLISTAAFDLDLWAQVKGESISILTSSTKKDLTDKKIPDPMPVPIELNLKLKGIAGLKILSTFKINNTLLPTKYQKFAYIINGLDHSIGADNQWITNITAKMYNI